MIAGQKVTNIEDARALRPPRLRGDCFGYMTWVDECEPSKPIARAFLHEAVTILNGVIEASLVVKIEAPIIFISYTFPDGRQATEEIPIKDRIQVPHISLPASSKVVISTNFFGTVWISLKYKAN